MNRLNAPLVALVVVLVAAVADAQPDVTIAVPMSDGVTLSTDVYQPLAVGAFPVVLIRTPYGKASGQDTANNLRGAGIATVVQDMRGRFDSGGADCVFRCDGSDGADTLAWLQSQSWCNGHVVSYGGSAAGIPQYMAAPSAPPVLDAMWVAVATPTVYEHALFPGGAFRKSLIEGWLTAQGSTFFLQDLAAHPLDDGYWDTVQTADSYVQVQVPAVHVGGWYDIFAQGTLDAFMGYQHQGGAGAKGKQKLVMGPWTHPGLLTTQQGELTYPANASDFPAGQDTMLVAWLQHYLGIQPSSADVDAIPAVQYYVMGDVTDPSAPGNEWRTADDWPVPAAQIRMHLQPGGKLAEGCPPGGGGSTSYVYDPADPSPTTGGANLLLPAGPKDQSSVESRADVISFSTPVLTAPLEITGRVRAHLWVDIDKVDTDLMVRLTDVYPDGRSMLVLDGALRLAYRNGAASLAMMTPGEAVEAVVDLWSTSIIIASGHRLRVSVTSGNAPRFWPNPNDGTSYGGNAQPVKVTVNVHHDASMPSYIELPDPGRDPSEVTLCSAAGDDAGATSDDAGAPADDAGAPDAATVDAGANGSASTGDPSSGCSCRAPQRSAALDGRAMTLLLGLGLLGFRRASGKSRAAASGASASPSTAILGIRSCETGPLTRLVPARLIAIIAVGLLLGACGDDGASAERRSDTVARFDPETSAGAALAFAAVSVRRGTPRTA